MQEIIRPNAKGIPFPRLPLPFYGRVALGNGSMLRIGVIQVWDEEDGKLVKDGVMLAIDGGMAYTFHTYANAGYVADKLGLVGSDAPNMADLINCQLENGAPKQGHYEEWLCEQ